MKKLCLLFVFCSLFVFAGCGSDLNDDKKNDSETTHDESNINDAEEVVDNEADTENQDADQGRKQGELYGECYPNETCNKGFICDVENNICIKDPAQNNDVVPDDDPDETPDEDTDTDSEEIQDEDGDADTDTNECTYNEEDPSQNKSCSEGVLTTCTEEFTLESVECELGFGCKDDGSDCAECQNGILTCTNNASQIGSFRSCSNGAWESNILCPNSYSCKSSSGSSQAAICGDCRNSTYKCANDSNNVGKYQACSNGAWSTANVTCPSNYSCKGSSGTSQAEVCGVCKNTTLKCTNESNGTGKYQACSNGAWSTANVTCPNNYSCKGSNGASIIGTSSATVCGECLNGSKRCVGNIAFQFCVSGAWSSSTNCQSGSSCQNGECVQQ